MSEYLSKEEIKQWRSSLEKITLEEFAARLGKKVEEKKETNDLIDIVLHGKPVVSNEPEWTGNKVERLSAIADRAYEKEKELYVSPFSAQSLKMDDAKPAKEHKHTSKTEAKKVGVSARSDGTINVQLLMEKMGGGGHFNAAAAQIENRTVDEVISTLKVTLDLYLNEARVQEETK